MSAAAEIVALACADAASLQALVDLDAPALLSFEFAESGPLGIRFAWPAVESIDLWQNGRVWAGLVNILANNGLSLLCAALGIVLAAWLPGAAADEGRARTPRDHGALSLCDAPFAAFAPQALAFPARLRRLYLDRAGLAALPDEICGQFCNLVCLRYVPLLCYAT